MPRHRLVEMGRTALNAVTVGSLINSSKIDPSSNDAPDEAQLIECIRRVCEGQSLTILGQEFEKQLKILAEKRTKLEERGQRTLDGHTSLKSLSEIQREVFVTIPERLRKLEAEIEATHRRVTEDPRSVLSALSAMPRILDIRAFKGTAVKCSVLATTTYEGIEYHLGTWKVYLGSFTDSSGKTTLERGLSDGEYFRVRRAVETRRPASRYEYPVYDRDDGSFCFGSSQKEAIDKHIINGQLVSAANTAITGLCQVTHEDNHFLIPAYFQRYEPKE